MEYAMQQIALKPFSYNVPAALGGIRRLMANKDDTEAVFVIMRALSGKAIPNTYAKLLATAEGGQMALAAAELAPLLDDHATLRALPAGSLGRAYVDFVRGAKISAEGLADESRKVGQSEIDRAHPYAWMARRLRDIHDLWHVITGYETDALGEACLVAFSYAQTKSKGFALIAFAGGNEISKALPGQPVRLAVWQAYQNGRAAAWLPAIDYEALLRLPLGEVRTQLNIRAPSTYVSIARDLRFEVGQNAAPVSARSHALEPS
jgi:ubiquinone biosynthesis protein COQ4